MRCKHRFLKDDKILPVYQEKLLWKITGYKSRNFWQQVEQPDRREKTLITGSKVCATGDRPNKSQRFLNAGS